MHHRGFTVVEILIAVSILVLLTLLGVGVFQELAQNAALRVSTEEVYNSLQDARNDTLASVNDTVYGVHVSSTQMIYFAGTAYNPTATSNVSYPLSSGVTATSTLTGYTTEIVFQRLTGNSSATGTITLTESRSGATSTLTIYGSGLIE